jgi:hypothetical protein
MRTDRQDTDRQTDRHYEGNRRFFASLRTRLKTSQLMPSREVVTARLDILAVLLMKTLIEICVVHSENHTKHLNAV